MAVFGYLSCCRRGPDSWMTQFCTKSLLMSSLDCGSAQLTRNHQCVGPAHSAVPPPLHTLLSEEGFCHSVSAPVPEFWSEPASKRGLFVLSDERVYMNRTDVCVSVCLFF
ncbi:hypothetical protein XENOCAPTIV_027091 [Xenoophorus captivus]|uniref:Uncharacterized protein n=1 Tax=Xenoophorus captivus TaxID=1517983 RepID=A0ABV0S2T8_9TELE